MILKILISIYFFSIAVVIIVWLIALSKSDGVCEGKCEQCMYNGWCDQQERRDNMKKNIYSGIMGLIVGDALGVPFEFKQRDSFHCEDMTGNGTYNQPPGTWSDDSSMVLATVDSIAENSGGIDPHNIIDHFAHWLYLKEYTPYGVVFDVGNTTRSALDRYNFGKPWNKCGGRTMNENGNGALMRILPLAFTGCADQKVTDVAALTHAHPVSLGACLIYVDIAKDLMKGVPLDISIYARGISSFPEYNRLRDLEQLARNEIKSSGYVVDTLEAALWCLLHTDNYKDAVLTAVNLGSDTDTVAAVTGGLAGIMYGVGGESGIPERWINQLARKDYIEKLISRFAAEVT